MPRNTRATRKSSPIRKVATVATALGLALLLSGCVIVPAPWYHPHGYYGWR
jgi:hypothetical protein